MQYLKKKCKKVKVKGETCLNSLPFCYFLAEEKNNESTVNQTRDPQRGKNNKKETSLTVGKNQKLEEYEDKG